MGRLYEATWGRVLAALYDAGMTGTEEAGLRDIRSALLSGARGRTIDLGAGTGANIGLFGPDVTEVVFTEPDPNMAAKLEAKLDESGAGSSPKGELIRTGAESLPFPDASFDTAVFTLVLCTVGDPAAALAETARVLRSGGRLLFCEHVLSEDPRRARWQHRLRRPWGLLAGGCHPDRDTVSAIEASPLHLDRVEHGRLPKAPPIVRPLAWGSASRV